MTGPHLDHLADINHTACSSAFSDADLFHRDVSFGNIMIGLDNEGKLNDWDLCRGVNVDKNLEGPRTVRGFCMRWSLHLHPSTGNLAVHVY